MNTWLKKSVAVGEVAAKSGNDAALDAATLAFDSFQAAAELRRGRGGSNENNAASSRAYREGKKRYWEAWDAMGWPRPGSGV